MELRINRVRINRSRPVYQITVVPPQTSLFTIFGQKLKNFPISIWFLNLDFSLVKAWSNPASAVLSSHKCCDKWHWIFILVISGSRNHIMCPRRSDRHLFGDERKVHQGCITQSDISHWKDSLWHTPDS